MIAGRHAEFELDLSSHVRQTLEVVFCEMETSIPMVRLTRMVPQLVWLVWLVSFGCSDDPVEQTSTKMTPWAHGGNTVPTASWNAAEFGGSAE